MTENSEAAQQEVVKKPKLKMSNRMFRVLLIIPMTLLLIVALVLNTVASMLGSTLDTYLGKGTISVVTPTEKATWQSAYYTEPASAEAAKEAAYEVAAQVQDEGVVLLKNESATLPLAQGSTVMPFGYAYLNPIYGQLTSGGSAKWVYDPVTPEQGLAAFNINTAAVDAMKAAGEVTPVVEAEGTTAASAGEGSYLGGDCKLYEYDPSIYGSVAADPEATGLVFISRSGQEGQDQKADAYEDGTSHYLALSANERGTIAAAKEKCGKVVVVLVSSAPLEVQDLMEGELAVDGILYYGHPGERGFTELSAILDGEVNPSGRTVDLWSSDFLADGNIATAGQNTYSNLEITSGSVTNGGTFNRAYNEYQEGVYMGYRYYETAAEVDSSFDYDSAVVYPFGYGLSYTTFSQTLDSVAEQDGNVVATVTVTNTGNVAGKEVAQLYYASPYTQLDQEMQIEKPTCVLAAFAKTDKLQPGQSQTLTLTFAKEDMASYSYLHNNGDGTTGCYVLEAGDYVLSLRANSHEVIATAYVNQAETIWYDGSDDAHIRQAEKDMQSQLDDEGNVIENSADYIAATNKFQDSSDYMNTDSHILSRSDWAGTQPTNDGTKEISAQFTEGSDLFVTFDPATDETYGNVEGSEVYAAEQPTSKADNGLTVSDMRGLDYDDPKWDELLDQIDWDADKDGIIQNLSGDAYVTAAIESIGLPETIDMDGANGLKVSGGTDGSGYDMSKSSSFGYAPLMASTWNVDLLYQVGEAFGQESLAHGINGWYAPAINLHRSMFSGRVFEYYSEDPLLSGKLAAAAMSGAGDQGMYCYLKHFALNETDTGRAELVATWADEQTMRELYLRPFEIALNEARMTISYTADEAGTIASKTMRAGNAIMATQTCVGTRIGQCNDALLQDLLRDEWGFEGMVISDYWVWNGNNLRDLAVRTGCDTYLCMYMPLMWSISDYDSATARTAIREAIHNVAYTVANSNAMQGMVPGSKKVTSTSPWQYGVWGATGVIVLLIAGGIVLIVHRTKEEKAAPELYKRSKRKQAKLDAKLAAGK